MAMDCKVRQQKGKEARNKLVTIVVIFINLGNKTEYKTDTSSMGTV